MTSVLRTISPVDGSVYVERPLASTKEIEACFERARTAWRSWRKMPLRERASLTARMVECVVSSTDALALELTWQMGRPLRHSPGEIRGGFAERGRVMIALAEGALADIDLPLKPGFRRLIRRQPLGVVLVLAPWNYPWLTAVNSVVPALVSGNVVVLKHSHQTPLVAERWKEAADEAGLPQGVMQFLHLSHEQAACAVADARVDHVAFTGSVEGGRAVHRAAAGKLIAVGLELGGKDPAYVRPDADLAFTVESLADGAFFNSGQSCCAVERIYVHGDVYDEFVEAFVERTKKYRLGDPTDPRTTLGPMVRESAAQVVRRQVASAVAAGAQALIDPTRFRAGDLGASYLAPQVLVDVDHAMDLMTAETFGPAVGIMRVPADDEAIELMNDSRYGLTASVWTTDPDRAMAIGDRIETGTWFMNRCDYLDPELAWVGVGDSGRGCTLSAVGYEHLTRPKSYHLRVAVA